MENNTSLNRILDDFSLACSIHNTIHKTLLDLPEVLKKFPPENRALRKALSEQFLELLSAERDEVLESAISAYKYFKLGKSPHATTDPEPSLDNPKV